MIAGRSPRTISSHKRRLVEPKLPKYIPFTQVDGLIVLKFDIPVQPEVFLPPQPVPTTTQVTQPTSQPVFSLQASSDSSSYMFAGLSFLHSPLPNLSPTPQSSQPILPVDHLGPQALDKILPGVVVDLVVADGGAVHDDVPDLAVVVDDSESDVAASVDHGGAVSAVAGVVAVDEGGVMVAHHYDVPDSNVVADESDHVTVFVDHGGAPASVHRCVDDDVFKLYTSAPAAMATKLVRTRRPMGPRSIRFVPLPVAVSPMPPSTLLPSESMSSSINPRSQVLPDQTIQTIIATAPSPSTESQPSDDVGQAAGVHAGADTLALEMTSSFSGFDGATDLDFSPSLFCDSRFISHAFPLFFFSVFRTFPLSSFYYYYLLFQLNNRFRLLFYNCFKFPHLFR
jgi:hypothetical protein